MSSLFDFFRDIGDAAHDIVDLYFIQTDLKDVNITPAEKSQTAYFDAMASNTSGADGDIPIGKQVW